MTTEYLQGDNRVNCVACILAVPAIDKTAKEHPNSVVAFGLIRFPVTDIAKSLIGATTSNGDYSSHDRLGIKITSLQTHQPIEIPGTGLCPACEVWRHLATY